MTLCGRAVTEEDRRLLRQIIELRDNCALVKRGTVVPARQSLDIAVHPAAWHFTVEFVGTNDDATQRASDFATTFASRMGVGLSVMRKSGPCSDIRTHDLMPGSRCFLSRTTQGTGKGGDSAAATMRLHVIPVSWGSSLTRVLVRGMFCALRLHFASPVFED